MFIVWGTKPVRRKKGYVADFCPICRSIKTFKVIRVGMAGHVYYITLTSGKLAGYELICQCCKATVAYEALPQRNFGKRGVELEELISYTYPNIREVYSDRILFEKQLLVSPEKISKHDRDFLIGEVLNTLSYEVDKRFSQTNVDMGVIAFIAMAVILPMPLATFLLENFETANIIRDYLIWGIASIFIIGAIYRWLTITRRYMKKKIYPKFIRALKIIKPREDEIQEILDKLKLQKCSIGKKFKTKHLFEVLEKENNEETSPI